MKSKPATSSSSETKTAFFMRSLARAILSFFAILFASLALGLTAGCIGPDSENKSARPWNTPRPWEHGIPGGISERR
jgi:hypothetical protein